jgi:hypothetical protein
MSGAGDVHHAAMYSIRGTFAGGRPGDGFAGLLALYARSDGTVGGLRLKSFVVKGRTVPHRPDELLDDVRITPAGAVSFRRAVKGGSPWTFTAFVSGRTISGSHRLERGPGETPLTGSFSGEQMEDPPVH